MFRMDHRRTEITTSWLLQSEFSVNTIFERIIIYWTYYTIKVNSMAIEHFGSLKYIILLFSDSIIFVVDYIFFNGFECLNWGNIRREFNGVKKYVCAWIFNYLMNLDINLVPIRFYTFCLLLNSTQIQK